LFDFCYAGLMKLPSFGVIKKAADSGKNRYTLFRDWFFFFPFSE